MKIKTDIDPAVILKTRGLDDGGKAMVFLAQTVANLCDPYIPKSDGAAAHMKGQYEIAPDGSTITYDAPYAHFQYVGEVMVGASGSPWAKSGEKKRYTGRELTYSGGGLRGKEWDKRMMADRGDEVVKALADHLGGKVK